MTNHAGETGPVRWFPSSLWYRSPERQDRRRGRRLPRRVAMAGQPVPGESVQMWRNPPQQPVGSDCCSVCLWVSCHMTQTCGVTSYYVYVMLVGRDTSRNICCLLFVCLFVFRTASTSLRVYLGRLALANSSPYEVLREVRRIVIHPLYIIRTRTNDIALLELSTPVTFTNYIRPVCLAAGGSD